MKSVTFSAIERVPEPVRHPALHGVPQRLKRLALTLVAGLAALIWAVHRIDPGAPLAYVVAPVLAGGLLPLLALLPGRLEVRTRFDACHLAVTLDDALARLGYAPAGHAPGSMRYRARGGREIAVTVRAHALEVMGPMPALRALRRQMAR